MWVSRLRVNGGFLSGLDIRFIEGLNVVIGPRGAGKTTLLELIRHAIGAEHADRSREAVRQSFIAAVLGSGEVVLDLQDVKGGFQIIVDAKGRGRRSDIAQTVLVLGQSELEEIASDAASRLRLLDLRAGVVEEVPSRGAVGVLTTQMFEARKQLEYSREESAKRVGLEADREIYRSQEASIIGSADSPLATQRDTLRVTEERSTDLARRLEGFARAGLISSELRETIESAKAQHKRLSSVGSELTSSDSGLAAAVDQVSEAVESLRISVESLEAQLQGERVKIEAQDAALKEVAAPLRAQLEEKEAGLGQLTAQIRNIDAQLRELDDNDSRIKSFEHDIETLRAEREAEYARIEASEERLFQSRLAIAEATSKQIDTHIVVVVDHLSDTTELRTLLSESLKGTHTRASLIDSLAARLLPRLLLEFVENQDVDGLASAGAITLEQAGRVIGALDSAESLGQLSKVALLDSVDFLLRDGATDKSVDTLSTGQKCAVTLPIVLSERVRTLILDQPEDHLDNAYLVDHVVTGMGKRTLDGVQTIVATHNANIPVLGSAGGVFVLSSDGQHGQISAEGPFDANPIVKSITSLMEGGRQAFARRHKFYETHGSLE